MRQTFTIKCAAKSVSIYQTAINSGLGNPVGQAETQLSKSIVGKLDNDLLDAAYTSENVYTPDTLAVIGYDGIVDANTKFEDEEDGIEKVMFINPKQEGTLLKDDNFKSADKFDKSVIVTGSIGKIGSCWVKKSKKIKLMTYEKDTEKGTITIVADSTAESDTNKHLSTVQPTCKDELGAVDSAMAVADNLVPRIADTLPRVVTGISSLAQKLAPHIPPLIEQLLPSLIQGATSLLSELVNNLPGILETLLPGIGGELGQSISTALNSIFSTLTSILPSILQLVGPVLTTLSTLLNLLLPPMMQIIQAVLPPLTNLINMLLPPVTQIIQSLLPVLMSILQPILGLLQPFLDLLTPIIDLVMQVVGPLTDLINMILPPLAEILSMLMEDYLNVLQPILEWYCKMLSGTLKSAIKLIVTAINNCKESFAAAWRGIKKAWNAAPEFFSGIWSSIKGTFSAVGTWFSDIFGKAWAGIKNAFSPMVNFFSSTWQKIKNIFSKVGTAIADGLKGAVTSAVNAILSKATGIINGFIRAINSAISVLNKIPKVSISRIDELDAPQLAEGGVLKRGQVGILEGNGAEAVVPLEKNTGWIRKVAEDMAEATGGAVTGDSESLKVLYKILEIIRHIDDNMYEWILTALTEGVRLKLDGREFGRMVRNA